MKTIIADERGRITLGAKLLEKFGKEFIVVSAGTEITLAPISRDPISELRKLGKEAGLSKHKIKDLKRMARKQAEEEIG